jgi:hypothetical protein
MNWAEGFSTRSGCEELLSGVALAVVAQLLSAPEQAPPPPERSPPPVPSPRSEPVPSAAPSPESEPPGAPAPPPSAQRAAPKPSRPAELPQAPAGPVEAPASPERLRLEAGLGAILGLGLTPGAAAGMTLAVGVRRSDWSIALEGRGLVSLAQEEAGVSLGTRAYTTASIACLRGRRLFGCGVATLGVVRFVPDVPWNIISPTQPTLGFGTRLGSEWPLSDRWSAHGYAEVVWIVADAVLRRRGDSSDTPGPLIWSSPPLGAAIGVGVTTAY